MNFSFYIYGNPGKRYSQYPDDYTASTLSALTERVTGAQLTIYREMDLVHYAYSENLGNGNVFGFCLIFNKSHCLRPGRLVDYFRSLVENHMVETGRIIKYNSKGGLEFNVKALSDGIKEYERIKDLVNTELESRGVKYYGIIPLKTTFNGERTSGTLGNDATDRDIIEMTDLHNKVVVKFDEGVEHGHIPQVINGLRAQLLQAQGDAERLKKENNALNKQKKQYRYVMLLSLALIGFGCGLFFLNNNLNTTKGELANAKQTISNQSDSLQNHKQRIVSLETNINILQDTLDYLKNNFNAIKTVIDQTQPFLVIGTSFNFSTGVLTFDYYGFADKQVKLFVRAYNGNQSHINSSIIDIQEGYNSNTIFVAQGLDGNKWYSFELLTDDEIIIGGGRH